MLEPEYLDSISDDLVYLYNELDANIKADIFRRIKKLRKITALDEYQAEIIRQLGGLNTDVRKLITSYNGKADALIDRIFLEALSKNKENDLRYYTAAKRSLSKNQTQILNASIDRFYNAEKINKTFASQASKIAEIKKGFVRMTLTVADSSQKVFLSECNSAYMKVASGAYTWDSAYKTAVTNLAKNAGRIPVTLDTGTVIKTPAPIVYTGSGSIRRYSIESAVRANIITGINQTAAQQTLENCDSLGCDLVEVSAHIGARDDHAAWQGKVYCLNGERDYIDGDGNKRHAQNFDEVCEPGTPGGICGINCRHSYYPYFEGTPLEYSRGELAEYKNKTVTLNGKEVSQYEASQELRNIERNIRSYKTVAEGLKEAGFKNTPEYEAAANNLWNWQAKARAVTEETGLQRKYINEYIGTKDGTQPRGLKPKE